MHLLPSYMIQGQNACGATNCKPSDVMDGGSARARASDRVRSWDARRTRSLCRRAGANRDFTCGCLWEGHAARTRSIGASQALPQALLEGAFHLTLGVALGDGVALVVGLAAAGQGYLELDAPVGVEVQARGHDGHPPLARLG